ncbi:3-hydroxybutyryl-CoA dehydrogenase [Acidobacteria bacterium Mor1]|nr:3-hydroxybutyryl-CoA dehydrogenase [Acidobacteria bacterium Mor1]
MSAIQRIVIIGAGTMGHGIAQVAAACGMKAALHDVDEAAIQKGLDAVARNLQKGIDRGKVTEEQRDATLANLSGAPDLAAAAAEAQLVVEAVPENLELKRKIFGHLAEVCGADTLLASNTSSLPVGKIAEGIAHPERVVGMHFFNPVHLMALIEVVKADTTSDDAVDRAVAAGRAMGKDPIVVRDAPGFASSRLGVVLGLEAIRMVEQQVASPEDIDKAMTLGYRHPMGPLRLTDLVGLDVRLAIAEHLHRELDSEAFRPPELMRRMVAEGKLGKKSGQGFYSW